VFHLLCLRAEPLTPPRFAAVARIFGEPQLQLVRDIRQPAAPEVSLLDSTYTRPEDKPDDLRLMRLSGWHTDDSYFQVPAKITLLQALAVPERGGETRFANAEAAYRDLPAGTKARLVGLSAVHRYATARAAVAPPGLTAEEVAETADAVHPLVRTHDETGRKAIYLNANRTDHVVGLPPDESDRLLNRLNAHMTRPEYQYHHAWRVGDILVWDNRSLIHSVDMDFPVGQRRLHQRVLIKGRRPV